MLATNEGTLEGDKEKLGASVGPLNGGSVVGVGSSVTLRTADGSSVRVGARDGTRESDGSWDPVGTDEMKRTDVGASDGCCVNGVGTASEGATTVVGAGCVVGDSTGILLGGMGKLCGPWCGGEETGRGHDC